MVDTHARLVAIARGKNLSVDSLSLPSRAARAEVLRVLEQVARSVDGVLAPPDLVDDDVEYDANRCGDLTSSSSTLTHRFSLPLRLNHQQTLLAQLESFHWCERRVAQWEERAATSFGWILYTRPDVLYTRPLMPRCGWRRDAISVEAVARPSDRSFVVPGALRAALGRGWRVWVSCGNETASRSGLSLRDLGYDTMPEHILREVLAPTASVRDEQLGCPSFARLVAEGLPHVPFSTAGQEPQISLQYGNRSCSLTDVDHSVGSP